MSTTEEVIKKILALKPNLNREAVERLIDEERAKAAGLLTEEAAANLVASNLGLKGGGERIEAKLRIGDLTTGLSDVSLTARVIHIFPAHTFIRRDGRQGRVLRMLVGDRTGSVALVFWDEKADQVAASKIRPGKIVRLLHGYTRERRGEIEVNVGNRGQIFMEPMDAVEKDYPPVGSFFRTPGEVRGEGRVNLEGVVVDRSSASTFVRRDGSEGKVARLTLEEGGGRVNLVLWDGRVDEFGGTMAGTRLRVINGSVRGREDGSHEVHTSYDTFVEVLEEGVEPDEPVPFWTKLADLRDGLFSVNVAARVSQVGEERQFTRRDGSGGRVASVLLEDETGTVRLTLWDDNVDLLREIEPGTIVAVESGYTRSGFGGVDLNVGRSGKIRIDPEDVELDVPEIEQRLTRIQDLIEGQRNVTIEGQLLDEPLAREVETFRGPARVASFRVDDGTGEVRVSVWRDLVDKVLKIQAGAEVRIENCDVREPYNGLIQVSSGLFTRIVVKRG